MAGGVVEGDVVAAALGSTVERGRTIGVHPRFAAGGDAVEGVVIGVLALLEGTGMGWAGVVLAVLAAVEEDWLDCAFGALVLVDDAEVPCGALTEILGADVVPAVEVPLVVEEVVVLGLQGRAFEDGLRAMFRADPAEVVVF